MAEEEGSVRKRYPKNDQSEGQNNLIPQSLPPQSNQEGNSQIDPSSFEPQDVREGKKQPKYQTAGEYAQAVQQWIWEYHMWNNMNWFNMTFPFYAMSCMGAPHFPHSYGMPPGAPGSGGVGWGGAGTGTNGVGVAPVPGNQQQQQQQGQRDALLQNALGHEYKIPSLWKRVIAEFIDFFLLFLIKLGVTIMTVEYVGIVDLQKYDLDLLLNPNMDYNAAFDAMSELIVMEIINRVLICIFETLCLRRGVAGQVGGTTPGKRIMGLRVVSCDEVQELQGDRVRVIPAQDIGLWNALVRSIIKNFSLAFFFPVCFTVFFFQHNRAAYDIITNCMVVEVTEEDLLMGR